MLRYFKFLTLFCICIIGCFQGVAVNTAQGYTPFRLQEELPLYQRVIDGNTMLVSVGNGVQVYTRQGEAWVFQALLQPTDSDYSAFGSVMALQGNMAIITAPGWCDRYENEGMPGAVYVFKRSGTVWSQSQKITVTSGVCVDEDGFGWVLDLDGNTFAVSSYGTYDGWYAQIYFFDYDGINWVEKQHFDLDEYGINNDPAIALDGDLALAYGDMRNLATDGAIRVYKRSGGVWAQQTILYPSQNYEFSVALDGNTALVGQDVYVTDGTNWTFQTRLTLSDPWAGAGSTTLKGDTVLISISSYETPLTVYVFVRNGNTWTQQQKLIPPAPFLNQTTLLSDDRAIIGDFIYTQNPADKPDLLVNGTFNINYKTGWFPPGWTLKTSDGEHSVCNDVPGQTEGPGYKGRCAFLFKGRSNANSKLIQNVDLNTYDLNTGDKIKLTGFYNKQSVGTIQVRVFVDYASLPEDQARVNLTKTTTGYTALPGIAITLKAKPTRVRVLIQNQTTSGDTWIDDLKLKFTDNSSNAAVLPLPLP